MNRKAVCMELFECSIYHLNMIIYQCTEIYEKMVVNENNSLASF